MVSGPHACCRTYGAAGRDPIRKFAAGLLLEIGCGRIQDLRLHNSLTEPIGLEIVIESPQTYSPSLMTRSLVLCIDGTWNRGDEGRGAPPTNVWRMFRLLRNDERRQRVLYLPGVGSVQKRD